MSKLKIDFEPAQKKQNKAGKYEKSMTNKLKSQVFPVSLIYAVLYFIK